jgi:hypothetical protein
MKPKTNFCDNNKTKEYYWVNSMKPETNFCDSTEVPLDKTQLN